MKQTMTTTTLFKAILAFTILFAGFLAVAINYNRVYKLKNETISILEKYEGVSTKSLGIINNYLNKGAYNTKGNCETGEYGVEDLGNAKYELAKTNKKYYYCINYYCKNKGCKIKDSDNISNNEIFYQVRVFFKFNLPYLEDLLTFKITGETKAIKLYTESQKLS